MLQNLTGWHALIVLAIVFLLFGATKLPALAKSVGQSVRILKSEVEDSGEAGAPPASSAETPAVTHVMPVTTAQPQESPRHGTSS